jgi:peroxiredoxin
MKPGKKWLITVGISLAIVLGYTAGLLLNRTPLTAVGASSESETERTVPELRERQGKPFPAAELLDREGKRLDAAALHEGKVMLVLLTTSCEACQKEGKFLQSVVGRRKDIKFIGAMSFDQSDDSLKLAESLFPFKVYLDPGMKLARELNLTRVPIKIYLEDGVVKRSWDGASQDASAQQAFVQWLTNVK